MKIKELETLREQFPVGARVVLEKMNDAQAPSIGTKGTVIGVDDIGSIMVAWDNGSRLHVLYGEDICKRLDYVKVTCYGKEKVYDDRQEAIDFFMMGVASSEGSERNRYTEILIDLLSGKIDCSDKEN